MTYGPSKWFDAMIRQLQNESPNVLQAIDRQTSVQAKKVDRLCRIHRQRRGKFVLRQYRLPEDLRAVTTNFPGGSWIDVLGPTSWNEAEKAFNERTDNGAVRTKYIHGNYYRIYPDNYVLVFTGGH